MNKLLFFIFFILSIPSIGTALPKCGWKLDNCSGSQTYNNGSKYVGDFVNTVRHGYGTIYWNDGEKYIGDFVNYKRTGKGTFFWKNGDKYVGDFVNGKRTGKGTFTTKNNENYIGNFVNGKLNGPGTFISSKGIKKVGFFRDNKFLFTNQEWEKTKSNLCSNLLKSAKDGNVIDWKIFSFVSIF